jgi:hypothetical protein
VHQVVQVKKAWSVPQLTIYGDVEAITLQFQDKKSGLSDGFTFMGQPIQNASQ